MQGFLNKARDTAAGVGGQASALLKVRHLYSGAHIGRQLRRTGGLLARLDGRERAHAEFLAPWRECESGQDSEGVSG
jgi:hypothetical protein